MIGWRWHGSAPRRGIDHMTGKCFWSRNELQQECQFHLRRLQRKCICCYKPGLWFLIASILGLSQLTSATVTHMVADVKMWLQNVSLSSGSSFKNAVFSKCMQFLAQKIPFQLFYWPGSKWVKYMQNGLQNPNKIKGVSVLMDKPEAWKNGCWKLWPFITLVV